MAGSDLAAGRNIQLDAQGDILLTAQQSTASQKTDGKSSNASVGVGFSIGGTQIGASLNLEATLLSKACKTSATTPRATAAWACR